MKIYILRHGIAEERSAGRKDSDRALTKEGERKLRGITKTIERMDLGIGMILTSPYVRARQTAEQVLPVLGKGVRLAESDSLSPSGNSTAVGQALEALKPQPDAVLLVGHEPNLSDLVSWLLIGNAGSRGSSTLRRSGGNANLRANIQLKKGGLCKVSCERLPKNGGGILEWLLTPKQMLNMYGGKEA